MHLAAANDQQPLGVLKSSRTGYGELKSRVTITVKEYLFSVENIHSFIHSLLHSHPPASICVLIVGICICICICCLVSVSVPVFCVYVSVYYCIMDIPFLLLFPNPIRPIQTLRCCAQHLCYAPPALHAPRPTFTFNANFIRR